MDAIRNAGELFAEFVRLVLWGWMPIVVVFTVSILVSGTILLGSCFLVLKLLFSY
jgi:hypothetical protein